MAEIQDVRAATDEVGRSKVCLVIFLLYLYLGVLYVPGFKDCLWKEINKCVKRKKLLSIYESSGVYIICLKSRRGKKEMENLGRETTELR